MSIAWPHSIAGRILSAIVILVVLLLLISVGSWLWLRSQEPDVSDPPPGLLSVLTLPIPDGPNAELVRRGRYLTIAGDCVSCHTRRGGHPFEGGLGLKTPFGVIYSANLTSDRDNGIGGWTTDQFYRALHDGVAPGGKHLYPAFPYPHLTIVSRADSDAILAYLKTVPAIHYAQPANRLPFPVDIRASLIGWNAINFSPHGFHGDRSKSAQWNRGAYLVEGLGHCGACHTPKNALGAERQDQAYRGAVIENWVAPDLTGNPRTGLGRWTASDIVQYLHTGRNGHANASGLMGEVVAYSTSLLSNADLAAIAVYLKSLRASPSPSVPPPAAAQMRAGSAIFFDGCTACHLTRGRGQPGIFPPLQGSTVAQQRDPSGVIRLILAGARTAPTQSRPSFQSMPSFAWKLSDQEVADVTTYVRDAWGNRAPAVSARDVAEVRAKLKLTQPLSRDQK